MVVVDPSRAPCSDSLSVLGPSGLSRGLDDREACQSKISGETRTVLTSETECLRLSATTNARKHVHDG